MDKGFDENHAVCLKVLKLDTKEKLFEFLDDLTEENGSHINEI